MMTSPMSSLFNNMRRREQDSYSTTSGASKGSDRRKTPRFSLRRIFYRRPSLSTRSVRSTRSNSELETRSVSSLPSSQVERDIALQSMSSDDTGGDRSRNAQECPLCLSQHSEEDFPIIMTCHHRSCRDCLKQYLKIEITESRVNIACPECAERFHPNDIKMILENDALMAKYEEFMLRRILVSDPDARWCPAPDCGYAVIASGCASCPKLKCERPGCDTYFCYHCKQYWHPNQTCDAARAERSSNMRSSSLSYSHGSSSQSKQNGDIKPCPRCGAFIIKMDDGSCNHMTCAVCGAEFCWLCMKEISDLHYLSPSGCTFWGKKPWSRKKKILWQLGTLVGAPVGIGLVAGIAVPAMIIGIPVWVGRKLHAKYEHAPKHRRNLVITGGVTASILVSPLLAGLAVGIGVPILLAYVYGVVPISLCRSGGCGVTTTNSGGVRFEFDDDNDVTVGVSGPYTGSDAQSVETTSHNVANPSIGPSIGEMSVAMTNSLSASGSHMERVGILRDESDRDSASNRALAGASLSGSLCGSAVAGPSGFQNRLEVQADVATSHGAAKRNSLSSESANFSIDAKSATVSFGDDASTKALAGSICQKDKDNQSAVIPPFEVHVDVVSNSARYRHGSGSTEPGAAKNTGNGSPTSSRSVSFIGDEIINGQYGRTKRYKRQSLSVGDRIHEHAERNLERLSIRSFNEGDCAMENGVRQKANALVSPSQESACSSSSHPGSPPCSTSYESMASHQGVLGEVAGAAILPEVDSDRPIIFMASQPYLESTSSESSTETVSLVHGRSASKRSSDRHREWHMNPESLGSSDDFEDTPMRRHGRRTSCELAMKEGRLSPKLS